MQLYQKWLKYSILLCDSFMVFEYLVKISATSCYSIIYLYFTKFWVNYSKSPFYYGLLVAGCHKHVARRIKKIAVPVITSSCTEWNRQTEGKY